MKFDFECEWTLRIGRLRVWWEGRAGLPWQNVDSPSVRFWSYGPLIVTWRKRRINRAKRS